MDRPSGVGQAGRHRGRCVGGDDGPEDRPRFLRQHVDGPRPVGSVAEVAVEEVARRVEREEAALGKAGRQRRRRVGRDQPPEDGARGHRQHRHPVLGGVVEVAARIEGESHRVVEATHQSGEGSGGDALTEDRARGGREHRDGATAGAVVVREKEVTGRIDRDAWRVVQREQRVGLPSRNRLSEQRAAGRRPDLDCSVELALEEVTGRIERDVDHPRLGDLRAAHRGRRELGGARARCPEERNECQQSEGDSRPGRGSHANAAGPGWVWPPRDRRPRRPHRSE